MTETQVAAPPLHNMNKLYIFDFDGTLSDTGGDIAFSVRETQRHFGAPLMDGKAILANVGYGARHLIERTVGSAADSVAPIEEIFKFYVGEYFDHCTDTSRLYEGVTETLDLLLARGDKCAVFTNKPLPVTLKMLDFFGITGRFSAVFCPENLTKRKPDPEGIFRCMEKTGVSAGNTLMCGDSKPDIDAGRAAGVKTCGLTFGMGDREKLLAAGPDFLASSFREIADIVF